MACSITTQPIQLAASDLFIANGEQRTEQVRHAAANALLRTMAPEGCHSALAAQQLPDAAGLSLVALRGAVPGETLLRVPLALVLQTRGESDVSSSAG